jgi:anti-sigma regulatory factor (Ser/Thr protein kinase)
VTLPPPSGDEYPDLDAESGRGLFVVRTLSDHVEVITRDNMVTVRAVSHGFFP